MSLYPVGTRVVIEKNQSEWYPNPGTIEQVNVSAAVEMGECRYIVRWDDAPEDTDGHHHWELIPLKEEEA